MDAIETKKVPTQRVAAIQHTGAHAEIGSVYHDLYEWLGGRNVQPAGQPFTTFLSPPTEFDPASGIFEVCMPVGPDVEGEGRVKVKTVPSCTVAFGVVKGPYDQIPAHYTEMLAWLSAEGMEVSGPPREVYIKRPGPDGSGDPNEFVTEIQFPIG